MDKLIRTVLYVVIGLVAIYVAFWLLGVFLSFLGTIVTGAFLFMLAIPVIILVLLFVIMPSYLIGKAIANKFK